MKPAALYICVSTLDRQPEMQLHDLKLMASQRGYLFVEHLTDRICGATAKGPGLNQMMRDARRAKLEGRHIGRTALVLDCSAILRDRQNEQSLGKLVKANRVPRSTIG